MEHTDSFNFRLMLVATDETSAKQISHYFTKAGLMNLEIETGINNVIPKLKKDESIDGIILEAAATADPPMYIRKLRENIVGAQLPIVVLDPDQENWSESTRQYDAGANLVITTNMDEDVANHICWILQALLVFVAQFKRGMERFFKR